MNFKIIKTFMHFFFPALKNKYATYALAIFSITMTIMGTMNYPGANAYTYVLFSFLSFSMLFNNFAVIQSYFFLYTGTLLWLGLWWKATGFFSTSIRLVETTGFFDYTLHAFDKSMIVCSAGMLALFAAIKVFNYFKLSSVIAGPVDHSERPLFAKLNFRYSWIALYAVVFIFSALNFALGLQQAGLQPRTILPFPLNAFIFFMLSAGFGILTSMLMYYQIRFGKKSDRSNLLLAMSFITLLCISTLSRANIIFYPIAILVAAFLNRPFIGAISHLNKLKIAVVVGLIYVVSFSSISLLRDYYFIPASNVPVDPIAIMKSNGVAAEGNKVVIAFKRLLISRWIGYEGVMTAVGNPNNSPALLLDLITQKPELYHPDKYLKIARSGFDLTTSNKFMPTTLPGPVGFVYLSGSISLVFVIIFALLIGFAGIEYLISRAFKNPFLSSFYGMVSSIMFIHIGLAPINILKFYVLFGLTLATVYIAKRIFTTTSSDESEEDVLQYHF